MLSEALYIVDSNVFKITYLRINHLRKGESYTLKKHFYGWFRPIGRIGLISSDNDTKESTSAMDVSHIDVSEHANYDSWIINLALIE